MPEFYPLYIYSALVFIITLLVLGASALIPSKRTSPTKFLPYESGIQTKTHLQQERFPMHHYLVSLIFLVFDVEVIFLYPWAVIAKEFGSFAFYEMAFFMAALLIGLAYIWKKGGLEWD